MKKVAVTGAAGFVGTNLCLRLAKKDWVDELHLVDNHCVNEDAEPGYSEALKSLVQSKANVKLYDVSAGNHDYQGIDSVVHLGALGSVPRSMSDPKRSFDMNISDMIELMDSVREERIHMILAGSSSVYGGFQDNGVQHNGMVPYPKSPYAATKAAAESILLGYSRGYGLPALPFRFFNIFGPYQKPEGAYAAVIPIWMKAIYEGKPITIHGDGTQCRDFTYVDSVCEVIMESVRSQATSDFPVNLAWSKPITLLDLVELLEEVTGEKVDREFTEPRPGDVHFSKADDKPLREMMPSYEPYALKPALEETWAWMKTHLGN